MINDINGTSHTYDEGYANKICTKVKEIYFAKFKELIETVENRYNQYKKY